MNEITLNIETTLPANGDELQTRLRALRAYKADCVAEIDKNRESLTADNYRREKLNAFDGIDKRLKECEAEVSRRCMPDAGLALLVELAAARADVKNAVAARQDAIRKLKAENEPPEPRHTYVVRLTCTDAQLNSLIKKAVKDGADGVLAALPQSDKATKAIAKWFEENV